MGKKVLLSTDIGSDIDDALSLQTMFNSGIDLRGIYTVNGDVTSRGYIAKHMVDLAGKNIDVAVGEAQPLGGEVPPYYYFEECYVDDKFIDEEESEMSRDIVFMKPERVGIQPNGLEHLAKTLSQGKYVVFSIAPLTNISQLMLQYPQAVKNIEQLYVMGCRFGEDKAHEHNVRFDVPSAQMVFDSDIPIVVVSGDLCQRYRMPVSQLEQLQSSAGRYVRRMANGFLGAKTAQAFGQEQLPDLITHLAQMGREYVSKHPNRFEVAENYQLKDKLLVNLDDPIFAAFDPKEYFEQYQALIGHLRNPQFGYDRGNALATIMEMAIPKELSVADVYVPYCFLNQDRLETRRANVKVDSRGFCRMEDGDRHEVITDLDYNHFRGYIRDNLR